MIDFTNATPRERSMIVHAIGHAAGAVSHEYTDEEREDFASLVAAAMTRAMFQSGKVNTYR